ncbi:MAG: cysteine desulfurase/selenocysteine lyase [Flavobacteriaceae bacterium]|jgi:cysteine desulfurase/selenocysteine lyase|tara:strand:+ start:359 stop:1396 length:1038 start_codon:yes stop_codon:yes gene_type:complete
MYSDSLPLLTNRTYLNTAYVGPMSTKLAVFRRNEEEEYVQNGGQYKVKAYDSLEETHQIVAAFFGSQTRHTFVIPNFSFGIRRAVSFLPKLTKILVLKEDYPSLVDAFVENKFDIKTVTQSPKLEQSIESILSSEKIDVLALSIVQYTTGMLIDFEFLKRMKEKHPQLLIIGDGTQFLGAHAFDFSQSPFDVVVGSGYKWLMAGFGNGVMLVSEKYFEQTQITPSFMYDHIFKGHFNIIATASLRFAIEEFNRQGFETLMEQKAHLSEKVKAHLSSLNLIAPWVTERTSHSSIFSIEGDESLYNKLHENDIHCSLRGNGIRISFHYYSQMSELDTLLKVLENERR